MKQIILLISAFCAGLYINVQAQDKAVSIQCGELESTLAGNHSYTSLTVAGTMDVRDFAFIHENMGILKSIDLSKCVISGYDSRDEQYLGYHTHFDANAIPPSAFFGMTSLTSINLPPTITRISEGAFAGCEQLTSIAGLTSVEEIGDYAFSGCSQLKALDFPPALKRIGNYAFDKCSALQKLNLSDCAQLSFIGIQAFGQNINLTDILLPTGVTCISNNAFARCSSLQTIQLPQSLETLGTAVFAQCTALTSADLSQTRITALPAWTFSGCSTLTSISLPSTLTDIEEGAFYYCSSLSHISLPTTINRLASFAFAGCCDLSTLDFMPDGMESIARYCFYNNTQAANVVIPSTVSYIGSHAFDGCENANTFTTHRDIPSELGENVFANMNVGQKTLEVPTKSIVIYETAPQWQDFGNINGISASNNPASPQQRLKIAFIQYDLYIKATKEIADIHLYDTAGTLLAHIQPKQTEAVLRTRGFASNIYLIQVTTADGEQTTTKAARVIR